MRELGIDHLTALSLEPEAFARTAAEAGFASVSLRTIHIAGGEPAWAVDHDPTLVHRVGAIGVPVHAVEAIAISEELSRDVTRLERALAQGAELGAHWVYSFCDDTDTARCADTVAAVSQLATGYGLRLLVEPMPYRAVATLTQAAELFDQVDGVGLIVDTLHATRGGTRPADLADFAPELLGVLQLCDAPATAPEAPSPTGLHPLLHEARFARRLPGAGELPLSSYIESMPQNALITVEAPVASDTDDVAARIAEVHRATQLLLDGVAR